jgi:hypothetical protein
MKIFKSFLKLEGIGVVFIHFVGQCSSIVNAKFIDCKTSYPLTPCVSTILHIRIVVTTMDVFWWLMLTKKIVAKYIFKNAHACHCQIIHTFILVQRMCKKLKPLVPCWFDIQEGLL